MGSIDIEQGWRKAESQRSAEVRKRWSDWAEQSFGLPDRIATSIGSIAAAARRATDRVTEPISAAVDISSLIVVSFLDPEVTEEKIPEKDEVSPEFPGIVSDMRQHLDVFVGGVHLKRDEADLLDDCEGISFGYPNGQEYGFIQ